jgi:hypothetical protein
MPGLEGQRPIEIRAPLPSQKFGYPVDEIQREIAEPRAPEQARGQLRLPGRMQAMHPLEGAAVEGLCTQRDPVDAAARQAAARSAVTSSGLASRVISAPETRVRLPAKLSRIRPNAAGSSREGVPPPKYTVSTSGAASHHARSCRRSHSRAIRPANRSEGTSRRTAMAKSQ